jgi:hypothetical protein
MDWAYADGTRIQPRKDIRANDGVRYAAKILDDWTASDLKKIGVVPYVENIGGEDSEFFELSEPVKEITDDAVTVTVTATAKPLPVLKAKATARVRKHARALLIDTDWLMIRKLETEKSAPQAILDHRASIRAASNDAEQAIDTAADVGAIETIISSIVWPEI